MARHWAPLRNPDVSESRSRSIINMGTGSASSQFGQRPIFSEPGPDQPPPDEGRMGPETRPEDVHLIDKRLGSNETEDFTKENVIQPVPFHVVSANVSNPPTDTEIRAAIGTNAMLGDAFIIRDGSGAAVLWLIVKGGGDTYHVEGLTKAV